jgi:hypothetical protein
VGAVLKFGARVRDRQTGVESTMFGIGLSADNMHRLVNGEPIVVRLADWSDVPCRPDSQLLICHAESADQVEEEIQGAIQAQEERP